MSTTFPDADATVRSEIIEGPIDASVAVVSKPIWSLLMIMTGLAASLAWTGFLGWTVGKALDAW